MYSLLASYYLLDADEPNAQNTQSQIKFVPNYDLPGDIRIFWHFIVKQIGVGTCTGLAVILGYMHSAYCGMVNPELSPSFIPPSHSQSKASSSMASKVSQKMRALGPAQEPYPCMDFPPSR